MKVLILAGGKGTRLQALVVDRPKPMALVGGRPFLAFLLDRLNDAGLLDVTLSVGYKADVIRQYFGTHYRNIALRYEEETTPLGTGGAIGRALAGQGSTPWLVLNGDTFFELDYGQFIACWRKRPAHMAVAVTMVDDGARYGGVTVQDGMLIGFIEKKMAGRTLINAGGYILTECDLLPYALPQQYSFEMDFLQPQCKALLPSAFGSSGNFIDIGVPDELARAQGNALFVRKLFLE